MSSSQAAIERSAQLIVRRLLAVSAGEQVALVCDGDNEREMIHALTAVIAAAGAEFTVLEQPSRATSRKNVLTPIIERALEAADCLIGLTGSGGAHGHGRLPADGRARRPHSRQLRFRTVREFNFES